MFERNIFSKRHALCSGDQSYESQYCDIYSFILLLSLSHTLSLSHFLSLSHSLSLSPLSLSFSLSPLSLSLSLSNTFLRLFFTIITFLLILLVLKQIQCCPLSSFVCDLVYTRMLLDNSPNVIRPVDLFCLHSFLQSISTFALKFEKKTIHGKKLSVTSSMAWVAIDEEFDRFPILPMIVLDVDT